MLRRGILLLATALAAQAAADGRLEINASCALASGCFPGDAPGLPVTVTAPGSYVLTSALLLPTTSVTGIEVRASDVAIDLGGFRIEGPNQCSWTGLPPLGGPIACGSGLGDGIRVDDTALRQRVSVRNGSVVGAGADGVRLGRDCVVQHLRVAENGGRGILGSIGCTLTENVAVENRSYGLSCLHCTIARNVAHANGERGLSGGGTFHANHAQGNGVYGILASTGSSVTGNSVSLSKTDGVLANAMVLVARNAVRGNGASGVRANGSGGGVFVHGNAIGGNTGPGLTLGTEDAYTENAIVGNAGGTVVGGVSRGTNFCDGVARPGCP